MKNRRVFVDMDGVLADFDKRAEEILGFPWEKGNFKNWAVITKHPNFFSELEPMKDAFDLWEFVRPYNPIILTALPKEETLHLAEQHKEEWIRKYFGEDVEFRTGPYAMDKQSHCKPGDILIDDNVFNIAQWGMRSGIGIYHEDAKTSIKAIKKLAHFGIKP